MRQLPQQLPADGILVGWSLEPGRRRPVIGFHHADSSGASTSQFLEPIIDTGEGHLLTVAPTGAGKGTGCIIPTLLRYPGPVVVVDPKGENYAVTAARRREMGQEVILLDPFNITGAEVRHRYNPLDLADPKSSRFVEDAATLASLIAVGQQQSGDQLFWNHMGRALITAAIIDVMTMPDSEAAHLPAVRTLLNCSPQALTARANKWKTAGHPELKRLSSLLLNPAEETLGGYWAFSIQILDFLKGSQLGEHLGASDLDLNKILYGEPMSIYLVLPPDKLDSHASLLRLWIGSIISVITRRKQQPSQSTLLLVDEAAQLGPLPQLRQAITLLRGYGVRVWTFWQDLSQLRNLYPNDWETIVNNSRIQQYFGATSGLAADAVSKVSGFPSSREIQDLERDEMILNVAGDEPVIACRPDYRRDPPFGGLYQSNPFYPGNSQQAGERLTRPVYRKTDSPSALQKARGKRETDILAKQIFHSVGKENWSPVTGEERLKILAGLGITDEAFLADQRVTVRSCGLSFYTTMVWYDVEDGRSSPHLHGYYLASPEVTRSLTGDPQVIYDVNKVELGIDRTNVLMYLEFFCSNVDTGDGRLLVIESVDEIEWVEDPDESILEDLRCRVLPPRLVAFETNPEPLWTVEAEVLHGCTLYRSKFRVFGDSGEILMVEDTTIASDLPIVQDKERMKYLGWFNPDGKFGPLGGNSGKK